MKISKNFFFLSLAKYILYPDPHQHEKWDPDPDPHQNVLGPPHWLKHCKKSKILLSLITRERVEIFQKQLVGKQTCTVKKPNILKFPYLGNVLRN